MDKICLDENWAVSQPEENTTIKVTSFILFALVIWLSCVCSMQSKKLDKVKGNEIVKTKYYN